MTPTPQPRACPWHLALLLCPRLIGCVAPCHFGFKRRPTLAVPVAQRIQRERGRGLEPTARAPTCGLDTRRTCGLGIVRSWDKGRLCSASSRLTHTFAEVRDIRLQRVVYIRSHSEGVAGWLKLVLLKYTPTDGTVETLSFFARAQLPPQNTFTVESRRRAYLPGRDAHMAHQGCCRKLPESWEKVG